MKNIYFLGIGGIGMSALARYFLHEGRTVAGYDRTRTSLTEQLEREGAEVLYQEGVEFIPAGFRDPATTVVVYTPAIPEEHAQLRWFAQQGFELLKRSQMLGLLAEGKYVMAVAGTHGKTSTTTLVAWLNRVVTGGGSAFLGGGPLLAVEADEFDRSFLQLHPDVAVITSTDADHLDIYGTHAALREAFAQFVHQIKPGGALVLKQGVEVTLDNAAITVYRYAYDTPCDFYARNITPTTGGCYQYDMVTPDGVIEACRPGIPGWINIENAVAATAALWCAARRCGVPFDVEKLRRGLAEFKGVKRRFECWINTPRGVYMDDYAHHPEELTAAITSLRSMFPGRRLTALFQPHLYTRTRDFYEAFAAALSLADEVVLLPIYPAREEPIEGVDAELIGRLLTVPWSVVERDALPDKIASMSTDVVVTFGAGNIDACCEAIAETIRRKVE